MCMRENACVRALLSQLTPCWLRAQILLFAVAIMLLGRILEPAFGTVGFLRFLAAVNAANGAGVFACCVAGYALTQNANAYLYVRCRGVDGLVAAMLVALKAVLPRLGLPSEARPLIRAQALPVLALCAAVVLAAADVLPAKRALGWALGTFNAWLFLRHVQPRLGLMPLGEEEQVRTQHSAGAAPAFVQAGVPHCIKSRGADALTCGHPPNPLCS